LKKLILMPELRHQSMETVPVRGKALLQEQKCRCACSGNEEVRGRPGSLRRLPLGMEVIV
jgi:hypothetical protein